MDIADYQLYCIDCDQDITPEELETDGDGKVEELFCKHCGSNSFGFYRDVG